MNPIATRMPYCPRQAQLRQRCLTFALLGASLSAIAAVSGCGSDGLKPGEEVPLEKLYWALDLNHHAVTLSTKATPPYDTLTLVATPRTIDGTPLDGLPVVTYRSRDPLKVAVSADGGVLHTALDPSDGVYVVATMTFGNLKHLDSVLVRVVALEGPPPVLNSLSIHPTPPGDEYADSAKVGGFGLIQAGSIPTTTCFALPTVGANDLCATLLPVRVLDAVGDSIPGVPVAIRSSDEDAARVDYAGQILLGDRLPPSNIMFYASTTLFGITKADTLPFRIGLPVFGVLTHQIGFAFPVLKVGKGAIVLWQNEQDSSAVDINFADPTNVAEVGQPAPSFLRPNIVPLLCQVLVLCEDAGNMVLKPLTLLGGLRRFPVPGTYDYSSTALGGASGRIIVVDER